MDIFNLEAQNRLGSDNIFMKLHQLLVWSKIERLLKPTRHALGQTGYEPVKLFRALLLGQWHSLSDRELEHALRVRLDFMLFCDFSAHERVPDHSTLCRFRTVLVAKKLEKMLLKEINLQLTKLGLKVENATHAVIDATVIESAARPRKETEIMVEDRQEPDISKPPVIKERLSVDPDASWLKKGKRSYFGFKGFCLVDQDGYGEECLIRPANEAESPHFEAMIEDATAKRILSDKGNASHGNRQILKEHGLKNGIMFKAARGKPLNHWQKRFNHQVSKHRFVVEQSFGTLKRKFKLDRFSYMGIEKAEAQFCFKAMCINLLKALNKISLLVPAERKTAG